MSTRYECLRCGEETGRAAPCCEPCEQILMPRTEPRRNATRELLERRWQERVVTNPLRKARHHYYERGST